LHDQSLISAAQVITFAKASDAEGYAYVVDSFDVCHKLLKSKMYFY